MTEADMKVPPTPEPSRKTAEAKDIKCLAMRSQEESKMYITKCVVSLQLASPTNRQFYYFLISNLEHIREDHPLVMLKFITPPLLQEVGLMNI